MKRLEIFFFCHPREGGMAVSVKKTESEKACIAKKRTLELSCPHRRERVGYNSSNWALHVIKPKWDTPIPGEPKIDMAHQNRHVVRTARFR